MCIANGTAEKESFEYDGQYNYKSYLVLLLCNCMVAQYDYDRHDDHDMYFNVK